MKTPAISATLFDADKPRGFRALLTTPARLAIPSRHVGPITEPERRHKISRRLRGATAITVVDRDGVGVVIIGKTASGVVAARWWIAAQDAQRVATEARRLAGAGADVSSAITAVKQSAGSVRLVTVIRTGAHDQADQSCS